MKPWIVLIGFFALSGCNTIEGAGRDIAAGGNIISNAAVDAEEEIERETAPAVNPY